ncbi:ArsR/SmtB family transcription factor [Alkalicoccobacillus gibsonii]|jgi:DNA-binding transcriptional ArsR family regulator|uniref:ArsR/SmtB family transcription factor n=1 Tax=Alkalicoccobacillus gibsonii TaxID=79881 RepID=UPI001FE95D01|nr:winged helix-turn-helix domain-containing protein [Alkalicoccobacillus gibsonii]
MDEQEFMKVTLKQQKVISDPLRSRIIALLHERPMTPKQTSVELGKNAGTIYYHIQQLYKHGILEIDHTETNKGVVEKYYRSKATVFKGPKQATDDDLVEGSHAHVLLSDELVTELNKDIRELYLRYGKKSFEESKNEAMKQKPYMIEFNMRKFEHEGGEEE